MSKHAADLTFDELAELGAQAAKEAVRDTQAAGLSVVGKIAGRSGLFITYPDGRTEPYSHEERKPAVPAGERRDFAAE